MTRDSRFRFSGSLDVREQAVRALDYLTSQSFLGLDESLQLEEAKDYRAELHGLMSIASQNPTTLFYLQLLGKYLESFE